MSFIRSVCVYCGSADAVSDTYKQAAKSLGTALGTAGIQLVYGGGRVGLMGVVADAALAASGRVVGIIPQHIRAMEVDHLGLTELYVVDSMHTRKRMMVERSDAFVILPGGLGTLDEAFEIITWRQLRLHDKPIIIADIDGYWNPLRALLDQLQTHGFARGDISRLFQFVDRVSDILPLLQSLPAPATDLLAAQL